MSQQLACAGDSCLCHVEAETAVRLESRLFCSQRCAEGRGCEHTGCTCAEVMSARTDTEAERSTSV